MIEFTIYGKPVPKGRPRFARRGKYIQTYTPKTSLDYEEKVRQGYLSISNEMFQECALKLVLEAYFEVPPSLSKKKKEKLLETKYHMKRPDLDNIIKSVCDGLNGTAYKDDNQIVALEAIKCYTSGEERVVIKIGKVEE